MSDKMPLLDDTMTTDSSTRACAEPLTNQTLSLILTLTITILPNSMQ